MGEVCAGAIEDGLSFSGKFGSAGADASVAQILIRLACLAAWRLQFGFTGSE
jgi:hypothetical protein